MQRVFAFKRERNMVCRAAYRFKICKFRLLEPLKNGGFAHNSSLHLEFGEFCFLIISFGEVYVIITRREKLMSDNSPDFFFNVQKIHFLKAAASSKHVNQFVFSVMQEEFALFWGGIYSNIQNQIEVFCLRYITVSRRDSRGLLGAGSMNLGGF